MNRIDSFRGAYSFLSNFYHSPFTMFGIDYNTSEAAYQAMKTDDDIIKRKIAALPTPADAKRDGRKIKLKNDWNARRLASMDIVLYTKFSIPRLQKMLLSTGDAELIEGNTYRDTFYGVCNGVGSNFLGKLLMKRRATINESSYYLLNSDLLHEYANQIVHTLIGSQVYICGEALWSSNPRNIEIEIITPEANFMSEQKKNEQIKLFQMMGNINTQITINGSVHQVQTIKEKLA